MSNWIDQIQDIGENEQLRIALELSEEEEAKRKIKEFEIEEEKKKELLNLNEVSESMDGGQFKKEITNLLEQIGRAHV